MIKRLFIVPLLLIATSDAFAQSSSVKTFLSKHCFDCHGAESPEAGLDLTRLKFEPADNKSFAKWVKIHDKIQSGEMPPKDQPRPGDPEAHAVTDWLKVSLVKAERDRLGTGPRTELRRLTRAEYENTVRDLFDMPGIALQGNLPADGSAHGFDKNGDALDISHVNMAKYVEAADHVLNMAIATRPKPPTSHVQRISLASQYIVQVILTGGDAVMLKDKQPDPRYPPPGMQQHLGLAEHQKMGSIDETSSVGVFRHEDESFNPYFQQFATIYPGNYRIRASFWAFGWDKGKVVPARGTEAVRLSIVQLTDTGRGGGHPSSVLGYYDAPPDEARVHEFETWLNYKETLGFNTASLAPVHIYHRQGRAMEFTGPGIACDWLEVEGPLHDVWPPRSHQLLFGDLPLMEFDPQKQPEVQPPIRIPVQQVIIGSTNRVESVRGIWTVHSTQPLADADRLLAAFLPKAFRRPVSPQVRAAYVAQVNKRLQAGDCFETAMRWAYRAALCSPDFLYHVEETVQQHDESITGAIDDFSLASRLSYFLWNSMPDQHLFELAGRNQLHRPEVLHAQVERLLKDRKSEQFREDFLGQWLKLRQIAANDPDRELYPEFSPYLQDSMVAETRAYFRELIEQDLDASYLVRSDFTMLNEKLAVHYGIPGISGSQMRRVSLPAGSPRGGFLTQAAILKVTANGTTTSPVPRGAFVIDRLLGQPPEPPPPDITAVEPDVQGATTIREQLSLHRNNVTCAVCHVKIDPPGFAMEAFDVIGGHRNRYRSIGTGDPAPRGLIDPEIPIRFRLGPPVDDSGVLPNAQPFRDITEYQALLAAETDLLLKNMATQFMIYSTGRNLAFGDREEIASIVSRSQDQGGGLKTLIHEVIQSPLFRQ